ncbi:MAG: hypothetical protein QW688_03765 [Thermoprotei archaeon]
MRKVEVFTLIALAFMVGVGFSLPAMAAVAGTRYVAYSLNYASPNHTYSLVVNESVTPTSNPNLSLLTLALAGSGWNLTYTESVNSSMSFFPYLPSIQNKSLTYANHNYSLSFTLTDAGSVNVVFGGNTYKGTLYVFEGYAATTYSTYKLAGNLTVFPSSLLYAFNANLNGTTTLTGKLISTNLPLEQSDPQSAYTMVIVGAGVGIASVAVLGLGLPFIRHRKSSGEGGSPNSVKDYWVD